MIHFFINLDWTNVYYFFSSYIIESVVKQHDCTQNNHNDSNSSYFHDIKGFEVKNNKIALYEIKVNRELKIKKVKALKEFDNVDLSKEILKCLYENTLINNKYIKKIPKKAKFYIAYYYYEKGKEYKSFISEFDL